MTSPTSEGQHSGLDSFFSAVRGIGIRRRTDNKWVGGVCSGIADRLRIDPVVVRAGLVVLILFGGFGVAAYLVAWALLPDQQDRIPAERALREGHAGSIVLLVFAGIAVVSGFPWWFGGHGGAWGFPWGLVVIGAVVWFVVRRSRTDQPVLHPPSQPVPPAAGAGAGAGEGSHEPAAQRPASAWGDEVGQRAGTWGQQVGERAGAWGSQAGERAGTWGSQVGQQAAVRRRERRPSGGLLMTLVGIGLAMVAYGATLWLGDSLGFRGDHHVIALAGALAALGLLVLGLGVAGWRAGFLGFLAVCTAVGTLVAGAAPDGLRMNGRMGDATWAPTVSDLGTGRSYNVGIGNGRLDLRGLPDVVSGHPTIPAHVGIGQLTVLVPRGLTVALDGHVGAGEISVQDAAGTHMRNGTDVQQNATVGSEPADVTLDANVGIGQITVVKE
jgi:phage shock protein PspC (stress-responsive transcriptional regulator)